MSEHVALSWIGPMKRNFDIYDEFYQSKLMHNEIIVFERSLTLPVLVQNIKSALGSWVGSAILFRLHFFFEGLCSNDRQLISLLHLFAHCSSVKSSRLPISEPHPGTSPFLFAYPGGQTALDGFTKREQDSIVFCLYIYSVQNIKASV